MDPGNAGADGADPQTWNGYGYVRDNPLNSLDPSGACDVVIGGLTQAPGTRSTAKQEDFAKEIGAIPVFPFAGSQHPMDLATLFAENGSSASTRTVADALKYAASFGGPVNVFAVSAGAAALTDALAVLPPSVSNSINNITYLIPASPSPVASVSPTNGDVALVRGIGTNYAYVTNPATPSDVLDTNCWHSANCVFGQSAGFLLRFAGTPCPARPVFLPGGSRASGGGGGGSGSVVGGGGIGWDVFGILGVLSGGTTDVQSTVSYPKSH